MSRSSVILGIALIGGLVGAARAQSPAELTRQANALAGRVGGDAAGVQQILTDLGALAVTFVQAAEDASLAGGRNRDELRQAYAAIAAPLEKLRHDREAVIESGERSIIEADGDLEVYYDSPAYQQAQHVAANARYYLNWLHYYGASLHDAGKRRALLRQARDGFSAFTVGDSASELVVESILGRGLCALDLGDLKAATEDLATVARSPSVSAERKQKARLSLLEAHVQSGNTTGALRQSDELLAGGETGESNWVRYMRLRALLDGAKRGGSEAGAWRNEAILLMDPLRRAGGVWDQRITALAQEAFADGDAWKASAQTPFTRWELAKTYIQKQDYTSAAPLLAEVIAGSDASLAKHKPQARYFLGLAHFRAGAFADALTELEAAADLAGATDRAERAYLIFKAHEALAFAAGADAALAPLATAAQAFVDEHPDHAAAFEARFRRAELAQGAGEFARALELYSEVAGDPALELQAAFAIAQCRFELLRLTTDPAARAPLLERIAADLDVFDSRWSAIAGKDTTGEFQAVGAKAAVMRAVQRKLVDPPDHAGIVDALARFETRFPDHAEQVPQVVRMRLEAWREAGDFAAALPQAETAAPMLLVELGATELEDLAGTFIRAGARRAGRGDRTSSDVAQQVAAELYEPLAAEPDARARTKLTLARLREHAGRLDEARAFYAEVLASSTVSTTALRGLARIAEAQQRPDEALDYWRQLGDAVRPGDLPWFESHYEQARVLAGRGDTTTACRLVQSLRAAMPGLQDAGMRDKLSEIHQRVCGS